MTGKLIRESFSLRSANLGRGLSGEAVLNSNGSRVGQSSWASEKERSLSKVWSI